VNELISKKDKKVSVRFLAKVLGTMISTAPALGKIPMIFARLGYFILEKEVELRGWNSSVFISSEFTDSLQHFLEHISIFNGCPMLHSANTISLITLLGPPDKFLLSQFVPLHIPSLPTEIFASDASNVAVCSYSMSDSDPFFFIGNLTNQEILTSSGHRELLAVKKALLAKLLKSGPWSTWTNIFWLTDSQNLVTFLTKGSTKLPIQQTVIQVYLLAKQLKVRILPIHLSRADPRIAMADSGSRIRDSDDWSLDKSSFEIINNQYGPFTLDVFADSSNAKCKIFFSDFNCPGTSGVDAFAHSWENHNAWLCPPVSKILPTWRKIQSSNVNGVLIIPAWKSANFWPFLFPNSFSKPNKVVEMREIHPNIIQNQRALSPLSGQTSFSFLLLRFNAV
jgi:hypothetical protein